MPAGGTGLVLRGLRKEPATIGKWHLGWDLTYKEGKAKTVDNIDFTKRVANGPTDRGFDYFYGLTSPSGPPHLYMVNDMAEKQPNTRFEESGGGLYKIKGGIGHSDWSADGMQPHLADKMLEYLDENKDSDKPFFLYMAHYAIHVPIDKDKRFYQKYINKGLTPKEAAYAALIEGMDKSLGDLMDWLDKNGEADNTIVIFMSDNGGLSSEPEWRDGKLHTQNSPLNSGKGSAYEGGVREPMIVRWPGVVKPDTKCDKYLIIEDFYPTILEMAQIKHYKTVQPIDGISFMPLLTHTGDPSKGRSLHWNFPNHWGNDGPGIGPTCTVRKGDWKLIYYYDSGKKELFNIPEDIGEKNDLAALHPDIVKSLSKELGDYLRKVGGQRPSFKATGKPCPWPDEIK